MEHDTKQTGTAGRDTFAGSKAGAWDTAEGTYWRGQFEREPYFQKDMTWEDYEPAYRFGYDWHAKHHGRKWEDMESDMASNWDKFKAKSRLKWEHAKHATRAAWDRMTTRDKPHAEHR
ncbi:MAG TPA: hypothetical protein VED01_05645 [Burkholderiales bacterium]|nr:hypothetical protein [Burkholderiales bacterium]